MPALNLPGPHMLEPLRPFFPGAWAQYGESLRVCEGAPTKPSIAEWLSDPAQLSAALELHAELHDETRSQETPASPSRRWRSRPKAVTSAWMLHYLTALLPPVVALSTLLRYRVPASWHEMSVTLNNLGTPIAFVARHIGGPAPEASTTMRYEPLVWQHLEPLCIVISRHARISMRVLRGNARRILLAGFEQAAQLTGHDSRLSSMLIEDRRHLLESASWTDGRPNPLFMPHRRARAVVLHATCCLAYQLPRARYCDACPLSPEHRRCRSRKLHPQPTARSI
jgi:ferric iron reductase protein FhuF